MSSLALALKQARYDQKSFWRNAPSAFFTIAFPLIFLVLFSSINSNGTVGSRGGISYITFFIPGILAFGIVGATYTNLAISLAMLRDSGVLKRVRGTPLPRWVFMTGRIGSSLATSAVLALVTLAIGILAYGLQFRTATIAGFALSIIVGVFCFCSLGLAVTTIIPNGDAAPAIVNAILFPLVFISGVFFPIEGAPAWLTAIAKFFPLEHFVAAVQYAFDPSTPAPGISTRDIWVMAIWGIFGLVIAIRFFRWESK